MDYQKIIDYLANDWEKFVERAKTAYEEGIDIALDQFDTFKKIDDKIKWAILGGAGLVVVIILLAVLLNKTPVPVIARYDDSGVLGDKFIAVQNESEDSIFDMVFIVDQKYVYHLDEMTPLLEMKIYIKDFHYLVGELEEGEEVDKEFIPYTLEVICPFGRKEIELTAQQKGWFQ